MCNFLHPKTETEGKSNPEPTFLPFQGDSQPVFVLFITYSFSSRKFWKKIKNKKEKPDKKMTAYNQPYQHNIKPPLKRETRKGENEKGMRPFVTNQPTAIHHSRTTNHYPLHYCTHPTEERSNGIIKHHQKSNE